MQRQGIRDDATAFRHSCISGHFHPKPMVVLGTWHAFGVRQPGYVYPDSAAEDLVMAVARFKSQKEILS